MDESIRKLSHRALAGNMASSSRVGSEGRTPVFGLLDNIRSRYNVGSIFRTSDGALVRRLFLCGFTAAPPSKEIHKTSLGAAETVPWEYYQDPLLAISQARSEGATICALERTNRSVSCSSLRKPDFPVCLVVGNELTGISQNVLASADMALEIPMLGTKQSLNVAVAYGIALYELIRIWREP